jgi:hypothetical protein
LQTTTQSQAQQKKNKTETDASLYRILYENETSMEQQLQKEAHLLGYISQLDPQPLNFADRKKWNDFFSGRYWDIQSIINTVDSARQRKRSAVHSHYWDKFKNLQNKNGNKQNPNDWTLIKGNETVQRYEENYNMISMSQRKETMKALFERVMQVQTTKREYSKKENTIPVPIQEKKDENNAKKRKLFQKHQQKKSRHKRKQELGIEENNSDDENEFMFEYSATFEDKEPKFYATVLSQWGLVAKAETTQQEEPPQHLQAVKTYIENTVKHATQPNTHISIPSVTLEEVASIEDKKTLSLHVQHQGQNYMYKACGLQGTTQNTYQRRLTYKEVQWKLVCAKTCKEIYTNKLFDVVMAQNNKTLQNVMKHSDMLRTLQTCNSSFDLSIVHGDKAAKLRHICFHVCDVSVVESKHFVVSEKDGDTVSVETTSMHGKVCKLTSIKNVKVGDILQARTKDESQVIDYVRVRLVQDDKNMILLDTNINPQQFVHTKLDNKDIVQSEHRVATLTRLVLQDPSNILSLFYEPVAASSSNLQECAVCGRQKTNTDNIPLTQCKQCKIYTCATCDYILQNRCQDYAENSSKKMLFPLSACSSSLQVENALNLESTISNDSQIRTQQSNKQEQTHIRETQIISVRNVQREFVLTIDDKKFVTDNTLLTAENVLHNKRKFNGQKIAWFLQKDGLETEDNINQMAYSFNNNVWFECVDTQPSIKRQNDWQSILSSDGLNCISSKVNDNKELAFQVQELSDYVMLLAKKDMDCHKLRLQYTEQEDLKISSASFGLHSFNADVVEKDGKLCMKFWYSKDLRANPRLSSFFLNEFEFDPNKMQWSPTTPTADSSDVVQYIHREIENKWFTLDSTAVSYVGRISHDEAQRIFVQFEKQAEHVQQLVENKDTVLCKDIILPESTSLSSNSNTYVMFKKEGNENVVIYAFNYMWTEDEILTCNGDEIVCTEDNVPLRHAMDNSLRAVDCSALNFQSVKEDFEILKTQLNFYFEIFHPQPSQDREGKFLGRYMTSSLVKITNFSRDNKVDKSLTCTRLAQEDNTSMDALEPWSWQENFELEVVYGSLTKENYEEIKEEINRVVAGNSNMAQAILESILELNRHKLVIEITMQKNKKQKLEYLKFEYYTEEQNLARKIEKIIKISTNMQEELQKISAALLMFSSTDKKIAFADFLSAQNYTMHFFKKNEMDTTEGKMVYKGDLFFRKPRKILKVSDRNQTWKSMDDMKATIKESSVVSVRKITAYGIKTDTDVIAAFEPNNTSACIQVGSSAFACHAYTCTNCQDVLVLDNACQSTHTHFRTRYQYLQFLFDSRAWGSYNAHHIQLTPSEEQCIFAAESTMADEDDVVQESEDAEDMQTFDRIQEILKKFHSFSVLTSAQSWCRVCAPARFLHSDANKTYLFCGEEERILGFQHDPILNTIVNKQDVLALNKSYDKHMADLDGAMQRFESMRKKQVKARVIRDTLQYVSEDSEDSDDEHEDEPNDVNAVAEVDDEPQQMVEDNTDLSVLSKTDWDNLHDLTPTLVLASWNKAYWNAFDMHSNAKRLCENIKLATLDALGIKQPYQKKDVFLNFINEDSICHHITALLLEGSESMQDACKYLVKQMHQKAWLQDFSTDVLQHEQLSQTDKDILSNSDLGEIMWNAARPEVYVKLAKTRTPLVVDKTTVAKTMTADSTITDTLYTILQINASFWFLWFRENMHTYDVYVLAKEKQEYKSDRVEPQSEDLRDFLRGVKGAISCSFFDEDSQETENIDSSVFIWKKVGLYNAVYHQGALFQYTCFRNDGKLTVHVYHTAFLNQLAVQLWRDTEQKCTIEECQGQITGTKKLPNNLQHEQDFQYDHAVFACLEDVERHTEVSLGVLLESCRCFQDKGIDFQNMFEKVATALDKKVETEKTRFNVLANTRVQYKFDCHWGDLTKKTQALCKMCSIDKEMFRFTGKHGRRLLDIVADVQKEKRQLEHQLQNNTDKLPLYQDFCVLKNELGLPAADESYLNDTETLQLATGAVVQTCLHKNIQNKTSHKVFTTAIAKRLQQGGIKTLDSVVSKLTGTDTAQEQPGADSQNQPEKTENSEDDEDGNKTDSSSDWSASDSESDDDYPAEPVAEAGQYHPVTWQTRETGTLLTPFAIDAQSVVDLVFNENQVIRSSAVKRDEFMSDMFQNNMYAENVKQVLQDAADKQLYGNRLARDGGNDVNVVCDLRKIMHAVYTSYVTDDCYKDVLSDWARKDEEIFGSVQNYALNYYATLLSVLFVNKFVEIQPKIIHLFVKTENGYRLREVNMSAAANDSNREYVLAEANFVRDNLHNMIDLAPVILNKPGKNEHLHLMPDQFKHHVNSMLKSEEINLTANHGKLVAKTTHLKVCSDAGLTAADHPRQFYSPALQAYIEQKKTDLTSTEILELESDVLQNNDDILSKVDYINLRKSVPAKKSAIADKPDNVEVHFRKHKTDMQEILHWDGHYRGHPKTNRARATVQASADSTCCSHGCTYPFDRMLLVGDFFLVTCNSVTFKLILDVADEELMTSSMHTFELSAQKLVEQKAFENIETLDAMQNTLRENVGTFNTPVTAEHGNFTDGDVCELTNMHFILALRNLQNKTDIEKMYGKVLRQLLAVQGRTVLVTRVKKQKTYTFQIYKTVKTVVNTAPVKSKQEQDKINDVKLIENAQDFILAEDLGTNFEHEKARAIMTKICTTTPTAEFMEELKTAHFKLGNNQMLTCKVAQKTKLCLCRVTLEEDQSIALDDDEVSGTNLQQHYQLLFSLHDIVQSEKQPRKILAPITIKRIIDNVSAVTNKTHSNRTIYSVHVPEQGSPVFRKHDKQQTTEDWTCTYSINQYFYLSTTPSPARRVCPISSQRISQEDQDFKEMMMPDLWRWLYHILDITPSAGKKFIFDKDANMSMFEKIFDLCAVQQLQGNTGYGEFCYDKDVYPILVRKDDHGFRKDHPQSTWTSFHFLFGLQKKDGAYQDRDKKAGMPTSWRFAGLTKQNLQQEGLKHFQTIMTTDYKKEYINKPNTEKTIAWDGVVLVKNVDDSIPFVDENDVSYEDNIKDIDQIMRKCTEHRNSKQNVQQYLDQFAKLETEEMIKKILEMRDDEPLPVTKFSFPENEEVVDNPFHFAFRLKQMYTLQVCTKNGERFRLAESPSDFSVFQRELWWAPTVTFLQRLNVLQDKISGVKKMLSDVMLQKMYQALYILLKDLAADTCPGIDAIIDQNFIVTLSKTITAEAEEPFSFTIPFLLQRFLEKIENGLSGRVSKSESALLQTTLISTSTQSQELIKISRILTKKAKEADMSLQRSVDIVTNTSVSNNFKIKTVLFHKISRQLPKLDVRKENEWLRKNDKFYQTLFEFVTNNENVYAYLQKIKERMLILQTSMKLLIQKSPKNTSHVFVCTWVKISAEWNDESFKQMGYICLSSDDVELEKAGTNFRQSKVTLKNITKLSLTVENISYNRFNFFFAKDKKIYYHAPDAQNIKALMCENIVHNEESSSILLHAQAHEYLLLHKIKTCFEDTTDKLQPPELSLAEKLKHNFFEHETTQMNVVFTSYADMETKLRKFDSIVKPLSEKPEKTSLPWDDSAFVLMVQKSLQQPDSGLKAVLYRNMYANIADDNISFFHQSTLLGLHHWVNHLSMDASENKKVSQVLVTCFLQFLLLFKKHARFEDSNNTYNLALVVASDVMHKLLDFMFPECVVANNTDELEKLYHNEYKMIDRENTTLVLTDKHNLFAKTCWARCEQHGISDENYATYKWYNCFDLIKNSSEQSRQYTMSSFVESLLQEIKTCMQNVKKQTPTLLQDCLQKFYGITTADITDTLTLQQYFFDCSCKLLKMSECFSLDEADNDTEQTALKEACQVMQILENEKDYKKLNANTDVEVLIKKITNSPIEPENGVLLPSFTKQFTDLQTITVDHTCMPETPLSLNNVYVELNDVKYVVNKVEFSVVTPPEDTDLEELSMAYFSGSNHESITKKNSADRQKFNLGTSDKDQELSLGKWYIYAETVQSENDTEEIVDNFYRITTVTWQQDNIEGKNSLLDTLLVTKKDAEANKLSCQIYHALQKKYLQNFESLQQNIATQLGNERLKNLKTYKVSTARHTYHIVKRYKYETNTSHSFCHKKLAASQTSIDDDTKRAFLYLGMFLKDNFTPICPMNKKVSEMHTKDNADDKQFSMLHRFTNDRYHFHTAVLDEDNNVSTENFTGEFCFRKIDVSKYIQGFVYPTALARKVSLCQFTECLKQFLNKQDASSLLINDNERNMCCLTEEITSDFVAQYARFEDQILMCKNLFPSYVLITYKNVLAESNPVLATFSLFRKFIAQKCARRFQNLEVSGDVGKALYCLYSDNAQTAEKTTEILSDWQNMQRNSKLQMLITTRLKTRNYQETVIAFEKCIEHLFKTRAPEGNNNMPKTLTECIKYLKETFGYNFGLLNFEHNQNDEVGVLPTKIHITPVDKEQKSELFVQIEGGMLLLARKAKAPKKTQTQEPDDVVLVCDQDDSEESSEESSDGGEDSASDSDTSNTNTANTDSNESSSDSSSSSSEEGDSSNAESNSESEIEKEEDEDDD